MKNKISIGVDVGGSHISCAAYDLGKSKLVQDSITHIPLNSQGSKSKIISAFVELIEMCLNKVELYQLEGIGIAMPGPFDYVNGIGLFTGENAKMQALNQVNLRSEIQNKLGFEDLPIRFINDATAFAIGEYFLGKLSTSNRTLAITLGTGFGSAFLLNGVPVIVDETVPENGCLWHLSFENGIADDYFSTRGLLNRYFEQSGKKLTGVKELADLAKEDANVRELFNDFGEKLAFLLTPWLLSFEVETIVFGGNISKASNLFKNAMSKAFKKEELLVDIEYSELQETAAFIGGAQLINNDFWSLVKQQLKYM